ncbi:MAG: GntR family transcriptional regulator [Planctomycetes bacterium]|nr:GntR family transcriptional regulator [Planctomycetota bacterium]
MGSNGKSRGQHKHERVRERLRQEIQSGRWAPGDRLPAEADLPKRLRASKITVVRALNDLAREGLLVRRRGSGTYVADIKRPPLLPGRHLRLGLLWPRSLRADRMAGSFHAAMSAGALREWGLSDVQPEFFNVGDHQTTRAVYEAPHRGVTVEALGEPWISAERHPDIDAVRAAKFDGILTLGIIEDDFLRAVLALNVPTVVVDYPNDVLAARADLVYVDPAMGYRDAVRRLRDAGCRRIHYVGALLSQPATSARMTIDEWRQYKRGRTRPDPDSILRLSAFRTAMNAFELPVDESWIHFHTYDPGEVETLAESLAKLPPDRLPEAIVGHGGATLERFEAVFRAHGISIPFAGGQTEPYTGPHLAVTVSAQEVGATGAAVLLSRFQRPGRPLLSVGVKMVFQANAMPAAMRTPALAPAAGS